MTMARKNKLLETPPFAVEQAIKRLGDNLRTARLRRNLTIQDVAAKIGTGPRAIADAEKGKLATSVGTFAALLWAVGLLPQMEDVADPAKDKEGMALSLAKGRERARASGELDNDF